MFVLSKTNYILFRECPKNTWLKVHKPDIFYRYELTEFEKSIIETGNEVELVARRLFPEGVLIEGRDEAAEKTTRTLIEENAPVIFQAVIEKDGYLAAVDILKFNAENGRYDIFEIKATNSIDEKTHYHDLAFQTIVLELSGIEIGSANLIHLNKDYVRKGDLELKSLFKIEDVTEKIREIRDEVYSEMKLAQDYLSKEEEPKGPCSCIYKGRSNHCATFTYSNPDIPEYGIHDLARIGSSKKKLTELIDSNIFHLHEIPDHIELTDIQKNQIQTLVLDHVIHENASIAEELENLKFPLYFLDYETFPCAIPRFDGFSPYNQVPFQYSLHVLTAPGEEPKHFDFIYTEDGDPSRAFAESLMKHIGHSGSVIVWHKSFECGRNAELARRLPETARFFQDIEKRVYDLEDIFKKQFYVHKDFRGSTSIKYILPVLAPELSYSDLNVRNGGMAADTWNKIISGDMPEDERAMSISDLREYCKLDTYAMYAIWKELYDMI